MKPYTEAYLELLGGIPKWLNDQSRPKPCNSCGQPIRLISAMDTDMRPHLFIVDAWPAYGGWVRVYLNDRRTSFRPNRSAPSSDPNYTPGDDPFLSFVLHPLRKCRPPGKVFGP